MHILALLCSVCVCRILFLEHTSAIEMNRPSKSTGRAGPQGDPTRHGATKPPCFFRPTDRLLLGVHPPPTHPPFGSRSSLAPNTPGRRSTAGRPWEVTRRFFMVSPFCTHHTSLACTFPGFPTTKLNYTLKKIRTVLTDLPGCPGRSSGGQVRRAFGKLEDPIVNFQVIVSPFAGQRHQVRNGTGLQGADLPRLKCCRVTPPRPGSLPKTAPRDGSYCALVTTRKLTTCILLRNEGMQ